MTTYRADPRFFPPSAAPLRGRGCACAYCPKRCWRCRLPISVRNWHCTSAPIVWPQCMRKYALQFLGSPSWRGTGGGTMRRRYGICAVGSVYLTRSFVVVRCGTSDQPSEHKQVLTVGTRIYFGCRSDDYRVKVAHLLICKQMCEC